MRKIGLLIIAILFIASTLLFVVIKTYGSERVLYFALAKVDKNLASQVRKIIERSSLNSLRVYIDYHRGKVINFKSDGLKIVGTLYGANTNSSVQKPAIVLLNGRSLYGRKLPLYRILSQKLADRGYIVLSIDLRGFGESDNPNPVDEVESWAEWDDVQNAISYLLKSRGDVDISKIYVVGHSHGSHIAVVAGIRDDRIKKIVAIGPSPHNREELMSKDFLERFSRDRGLKQILPAEVVFSIISSFIIQNNFDYFTHTPHKPILLVKGEAENEETKLFLKGIYDQMVEPKRYVIIPKSDHYMNTTRENTIVIYNKDTINEVVDLINGFLKENIN